MVKEISRKSIDKDALKVIFRLHKYKYIAYVVGGGVRDILIGRIPKDFDLVTDATPQEIRKIFRNSRIIGHRFKLAHIFFGDQKIFETSTFRASPGVDEETGELLILSDNKFGTPEEDAQRRDFTINGLFYNPINNEIIDFVDGLKDIENKLIRTIGDPDIRFQEDPVRIIRAVRFASKLGFKIERNTLKYIKKHRDKIKLSSRRRVVDEIWKTLLCGNVSSTLPLMYETGILKVLIPEIDTTLRSPFQLQLMKKTMEIVDGIHKESIVDKTLLAPLFFQFQIDDLLSPNRIKGDFVTKIFRENLQPLLVKYGYSRFQRDTIHRILQIVTQLGHPFNKKKISNRMKRKDAFSQGYICWQILWHIRGELPYFDISSLINQQSKDVYNSKFNNRMKHRRRRVFRK